MIGDRANPDIKVQKDYIEHICPVGSQVLSICYTILNMALPEPSLLLNSIPPELLHRFDPVYVEHYNKYNVGRLHTHQLPIEKIRKNPGKYAIPYARTGKVDVYRVSEQLCPVEGNEIKVRIFEPGEWKEGDELRGAYINYHGGGWTWGNLEQDDVFCRRITKEVGCLSFDVDYRLAPENRFPIPVNDSWAALKWVSNFSCIRVERNLVDFRIWHR